MGFVFSLLTTIYAAFLLWLQRGMQAIIKQDMQKPVPNTYQAISVIIAARNELINLPALLGSLSQLIYPLEKYELILVNDHSDDGSRELLDKQSICPKLKVIHFSSGVANSDLPHPNRNSASQLNLIGKKAAIQQGIEAAMHDLLAFTDADCLVPSTWLHEINRSMNSDTDYLLSPSVLKRTQNGSVYRLKNFERSVYHALAAAGLYYHIPFTSSASNMVYRKSLFQKSGGFAGIGHLVSGDDDLLLMKLMPHIRRAAYNPRPAMQIVSIDGTDRAKHHHTNIRRASKFMVHPWWLKGLSAFVFVYFCLFYASLGKLFLGKASKAIAFSILLKTAAEFSFSFSHLRLTNRSKLGVLYLGQILVFPAQFIFYALRGSLGKYRWK